MELHSSKFEGKGNRGKRTSDRAQTRNLAAPSTLHEFAAWDGKLPP